MESTTYGLSDKISSTVFLSFSTGVQSISSTFYVKRITMENTNCNALWCYCMMFHFYYYFILLACSTRYSRLPKAALYGAGTAQYSGDNTKNERIYADTQCRISHAKISILNPPPRIGRAPKVMGSCRRILGSTPLHDPQDAASMLQNHHRAVFRSLYPASWSISAY